MKEQRPAETIPLCRAQLSQLACRSNSIVEEKNYSPEQKDSAALFFLLIYFE